MKAKLKQQKQDEQRRMNQAYRELAHAGGYIDRAVKLVSLQYLVGSMVDIIGAELEMTLERANLMNAKTISIQNALQKATNEYYKFFGGVMKKESELDWANDLDRLEAELYKFAGIKDLRPKRKAMKEAKAIIEEKYNVKLEDLK